MVKHKKLSKSFYFKVYALLGVALIFFSLYNLVQVSSISSLLEQRIADVRQASVPAKIQLVTIQDPDCPDCFNITPIVDSVKRANINVTDETNLEFGDEEAGILINKYGIKKIPTLLLLGEINKTRAGVLEQVDDALVFTKAVPPYTDTESGKVAGRVSAILLKDSNCEKCTDIGYVLAGLKQTGVAFVSERIVERDSSEGKALIRKYDLESLPVLIFSKDLEAYGDGIADTWKQVGTIEEDGSFVSRAKTPPYLDLTTNRIVGLVSMTVLEDKSCDGCYNPDEFHKPILQKMGVVFSDEKRIDISSPEGQSLIEEYGIEKVPTILLEGDVEEYPVLTKAWAQVGTVEADGTYVFREVGVTQSKYKDLNTGKVVAPTISG